MAAFRYIDLFAGIGGFAAAMNAFGGECVYSVEIDPAAAQVYRLNWRHDPSGDITSDVNETVMRVPAHDILTAGFPCQPFSKSGAQRGMDEARGTLFWNIAKILERHRPSVVLLENVRNLAGPRHLHEWQVIIETLRDLGYRVSETPTIFSPHLLPPERGGRPQVRERVFVNATHNPQRIGDGIGVDPIAHSRTRVDGWDPTQWRLDDVLDNSTRVDGCDLTQAEELWINAWDDFVQIMREERSGRRLPGFPIWADSWVDAEDLHIEPGTPVWKRSHLIKNAEFYTAHKEALTLWAAKWGVYTSRFPPSRRKLEWQAQDTPRLWDTVMHFRPSGIRAKRPTYLPALVAITQTSIIGPRRRRLSPREGARLQGLPDGFAFGDQPHSLTYRQLGNGVNVGVVWHVLREHVRRDEDILKHTPEGRNIIQAVLDAPISPDPILDQRFPSGS